MNETWILENHLLALVNDVLDENIVIRGKNLFFYGRKIFKKEL